MRNLYPYMKPFRVTVLLAIILKAVSTLAELFIPYIMSYIIDVGIQNNDIKVISLLTGCMLVMTVGSYFFTVYAHKYAVKGGLQIGTKLRNELFAHIQELTIKDVDRLSTASLITRVTNDVEHIQRTVMMTCRMMVRAPLIMVGGTVMSLLLDPYLTVVMFVGMGLLFAVSMLGFRYTKPIYKNVKKNIDKMTGILRENIGGIRVIKAFTKIEEEVKRLDKQSKRIKSFELKAGRINAGIGPTVTVIVNLTIIGVLYIGGMRVDGGTLEIGKIVTILNYINMILGAMTSIPRMFMMFSHASTSAKRIEEVLELKECTQYGQLSSSDEKVNILTFKDVSFRYQNAKNDAIHNLSFEAKKGETIAIIGATGSGKTSVIQLILRLYEQQQGEIKFQGYPIATYDKDYLRSKITAAMQQYNIFSMSIKENIILDQKDEQKRLRSSVETAQINQLIEDLNEHYEHKVSQNGTNLSGGQKQRISIARTLYRKSDLVILDDVSSALDYQTDLKLRRALREKYKEQTVILISQRISSVKNADKILVLEKGKNMGFGTHEELLEMCSVYQEMCKSQEQREVKAV